MGYKYIVMSYELRGSWPLLSTLIVIALLFLR